MRGRLTLTRIWIITLALAALSGVFFLVRLARLPSDGGPGWFGFSPARLGLLLVMAALILGLSGLAVGLVCSGAFRRTWENWMKRGPALLAGLVVAAALILAPLNLLDLLRGLFRGSADYRFAAYAARLAPLCDWLALLGLMLLLLLLVGSHRELLAALGGESAAFRRWGWIGLTLAVLALLADWARLHFSGDPLGSWGVPTVPLLEWQIGGAVLATLAVSLLLARLPSTRRLDLVLSLIIWAAAALIWTTQPLIPGYFATPGRAPNHEIYPFSDGQTYDQYAQSILIGNGLMGAIPQRPLYIVFLALLHLLAGQDYLKVIALQQMALALLPVVLYWIGKTLHSRPAGVLAALLVILREVTAIHVAPFTDNISYSKLYFSEEPVALCLSAFTLFALRWALSLREGGGRRWSLDALLAGGFLGMAMLIRTQSLAVLPLALLAALWMARRNAWAWLRGTLLLGAGVLVCILPWLVRNYPLAGGLAFDNADSQTLVLAQRYNNLTFDAPIPRLTGEQEAHYSSRLVRMALQGMARDPGGAAWLVVNHWMNNEISNGLIFPVRFTIQRPAELLWPDEPFWQSWDGHLTAAQGVLVLANLGLLAAGLAGAVARGGAAGWIPLWVNLAYNFSTSVFRSSGGRFLLPVDWVAVLFYAVGWAQLLAWAWALLGKPLPASWRENPVQSTSARLIPRPAGRRRRQGLALAGVGLAFLLVGLSLPLSERIFPQRYPPESPAQMGDRLAVEVSQALPGEAAAALSQAMSQPGAVLLRGRALYPRYYAAGENEPKTAKVGYTGLPYPRLVFYLAGSQNTLVVLPSDQVPAFFPNAADVLILGCPEQGFIRAAVAVVESGSAPRAYLADRPAPFVCER